MKTTIIFHGTMGSPSGNWFAWLKEELEANKHKVYVPTLPTPEGQSVKGWMGAVKNQLPIFSSGEDFILVGHSCGATFLLHYLEQMNIKVGQSIFVSPVMDKIEIEEYDALNKTFIDHAFDWRVIKARAGNVSVLHGNNDPYVPIAQAHYLSTHLGVQTTAIENGGHLNSESGYMEFPLLLDIIKS
jgi:hypothetical protein